LGGDVDYSGNNSSNSCQNFVEEHTFDVLAKGLLSKTVEAIGFRRIEGVRNVSGTVF
jgi:hypothetical protein